MLITYNNFRFPNRPLLGVCYHVIISSFNEVRSWWCMNKRDFNEILYKLGPIAADTYSQEIVQSFPHIKPPSIKFELCSPEHVECSTLWPDTSKSKDGYGGWSWEDIYHRSKYSSSKFVLAVFSNDQLGGIFSGKLLEKNVELQYVQRDANCHSLKGFMIPASITYSALLGIVMSREVLTVCEPAPAIVDRYGKSMKGSVTYVYSKEGDVLRMSVPVDEVVATPSTD